MARLGKYRESETAFMVMKGDSQIESVSLGDKEYRFPSQGGQSFFTKNAGLAKEIEQVHGQNGTRSVAVAEIRVQNPADYGHRYFFGCLPEMPWKRKAREASSVVSLERQRGENNLPPDGGDENKEKED